MTRTNFPNFMTRTNFQNHLALTVINASATNSLNFVRVTNFGGR